MVDGDGTVVDEGDFIVPTSAVTFMDDWYVTGLRATGSCTVKVDGLDVPAHRFLSLPGLIMGNSPGGALHSDWVQRCAPVPVLTIALTGGALGIATPGARGLPAARHRQDDRLHGRSPGHPPDHARQGSADAAMRVEEGELLLYRCADEIDAAGKAGAEVPLLHAGPDARRLRRRCATLPRRRSRSCSRAAGATGVRSSSPLSRALADLKAINNHGLLQLEMNLEMYGRLLMGLEPNTPLI